MLSSTKSISSAASSLSKKPEEQKSEEPKADEPKAVEPKVAEPKAVESKAAEQSQDNHDLKPPIQVQEPTEPEDVKGDSPQPKEQALPKMVTKWQCPSCKVLNSFDINCCQCGKVELEFIQNLGKYLVEVEESENDEPVATDEAPTADDQGGLKTSPKK